MFKYGPKASTKIRPGDSAATMADKLDAQARELHSQAQSLSLRAEMLRFQDPKYRGPLIYASGTPSPNGPGEVQIKCLPGERILNRGDLPSSTPLSQYDRPPGRIPSRGRQMRLQDPEPKPQPHPDDGLPDPGNGRPCPPDTRGGCPPADPRPIPDPTPHPGGPVLV